MSAVGFTKWFWSDWMGDPGVRSLTPFERGIWIDCLALMACALPVGYLCDQQGKALPLCSIGRLSGASSQEIARALERILKKGVASITAEGIIYNRRMVRDAEKHAKKQHNGHLGGIATRSKWALFATANRLASPPQQTPEQKTRLPQQAPQPARENQIPDIKPSLQSRGQQPHADDQNHQTAGSLATALPEGALARQPQTEPVDPKAAAEKKPEDRSLAEINALWHPSQPGFRRP